MQQSGREQDDHTSQLSHTSSTSSLTSANSSLAAERDAGLALAAPGDALDACTPASSAPSAEAREDAVSGRFADDFSGDSLAGDGRRGVQDDAVVGLSGNGVEDAGSRRGGGGVSPSGSDAEEDDDDEDELKEPDSPLDVREPIALAHGRMRPARLQRTRSAPQMSSSLDMEALKREGADAGIGAGGGGARRRRSRSGDARAVDEEAVVSPPTNVQRMVHIEWDENLQAFTGVPDVWRHQFPQARDVVSSDDLPSYVSPRSHGPDGDGSYRKAKHKLKPGQYASLPRNFRPSQVWGGSNVPRPPPAPVSIREFMAALGFTDVDNSRYDPRLLREMLLNRLAEGKNPTLLLRLPYVLKFKVFEYLDAKSLTRVCSSCTSLLEFNEHNLLWKSLVRAKNREQHTLYADIDAGTQHEWKKTFLAMAHLDKDPRFCDVVWNVAVIGDRQVGKSRLIWSLAESANRHHRRLNYPANQDPVVNAISGIYRLGIDVVSRRVVIGSSIIKLQVWDVKALGPDILFRSVNVVLLVFDVAKRETFEGLLALIERTRSEIDRVGASATLLLFANVTVDDPAERAVSFRDAKRFANERGLIYLEANASDPARVDAAFAQLAHECLAFNSVQDQLFSNARSTRSSCAVM